MALTGKVGAWVWSAVLALLTLGCVIDGLVVAALFFLTAALAIVPVEWLKAKRDEKRLTSKKAIWTSISLAFVGTLILGAAQPKPKQQSNPVSDKEVSPAKSDTVDDKKYIATNATFFRGFWTNTLAHGKNCDEASGRAVGTLEQAAKGDATTVEAYAVARDSQKACANSAELMSRLDAPPSLSDQDENAAKEAASACEASYRLKASALQTMMEVIDGDARPSKIQSYKDGLQQATAMTISCVAGFYTLGQKFGIDLSKETKSSAHR